MITYQEAENYLLEIPRFAGKHTLAETKKLLNRLTGGQINSRIIHVAGTNGKGSVCAYLRSVLLESGRSVGMFTSPHLEEVRERICIGKEMISKGEFTAVFEKVREAVKAEEEDCRLAGGDEGKVHPSFFEYLFLMAMAYFKEFMPEYIILETGLGGRLDATNCLEKKEICIITEIGYDHMQYLGESLAEIAGEKARIMRTGVPVVFFDKRKETTDILKKYAAKTESPMHIVGKDKISGVNIGNKTIDFSFHTGYYSYVGLSLDTMALYQTENASLAVMAADILRKKDNRISESSIRRGLKAAKWPGRMEEILPGIYLDGAHNEDGIEAFLDSVKRNACPGRRFLLFGVASDKQYAKMIKRIAEEDLFGKTIVTLFTSDRSASLDKLREICGQYKLNCSFYSDAEEACNCLLQERKSEDHIYIAGSLYLAGQIRSLMRRITND